MTKVEKIPAESLKAFLDEYNWGNGGEEWAEKCIAAAINAWPGAEIEQGGLYWRDEGPIVLPIPEEKNDD